jgi:mannan polymerase II complex ANP1 subunit
MERERLAREAEEKAKAEKAMKIKEEFGDANSQWEKDKSEMQNIVIQEKKPEEGAPLVQDVNQAAAKVAANEAAQDVRKDAVKDVPKEQS